MGSSLEFILTALQTLIGIFHTGFWFIICSHRTSHNKFRTTLLTLFLIGSTFLLSRLLAHITQNDKRTQRISVKPLIYMVTPTGLEPVTSRLEISGKHSPPPCWFTHQYSCGLQSIGDNSGDMKVSKYCNELYLLNYYWKNGGESGIWTHDTFAGIPDFESGAFNRTLPPLLLGFLSF